MSNNEICSMTPERLAEIRAAEQAATPGPWRAEHFEIFADCLHCGERGCEDCDNQGGIISDAGWVIAPKMLAHSEGDSLLWEDAQFLALARTAVPELLAEVERLESFRREGLSLFADANAREDRDNKLVADLMEDGDIQRLALKHALYDLDEEQARAEGAESRAADLERQLAHEQTLRKSAEERVAELEALFEWREDEDAPPLSTDSDQTEYQRKWDLVEQARANHRRRVELTDALRASVEAAERKRGERRG